MRERLLDAPIEEVVVETLTKVSDHERQSNTLLPEQTARVLKALRYLSAVMEPETDLEEEPLL